MNNNGESQLLSSKFWSNPNYKSVHPLLANNPFAAWISLSHYMTIIPESIDII